MLNSFKINQTKIKYEILSNFRIFILIYRTYTNSNSKKKKNIKDDKQSCTKVSTIF